MSQSGRLDPETAQSILSAASAIAPRAASSIKKRPVVGIDSNGDAISLAMNQAWWLLLFVSDSCLGCLDLIEHLDSGGRFGLGDGEVAIIVRADDQTVIETVPRVISDELWSAYGVSGPPFFSLISATASMVVTEGVAWGVDGVTKAVAKALAGDASVDTVRLDSPKES
jgi:hypothetical protein